MADHLRVVFWILGGHLTPVLPEKVHSAGFHASIGDAELKDLFNKTSLAFNGARMSSLCN